MLLSSATEVRLDTNSRSLASRKVISGALALLLILSFSNRSAGPEEQYFGDGSVEEIIACLRRRHSQNLGIIAMTSAMKYEQSMKDVHEIRHELNVDSLVEGSVRTASNRVRITARLVRALDQICVWTNEYENALEDVLGVQTEVADDSEVAGVGTT